MLLRLSLIDPQTIKLSISDFASAVSDHAKAANYTSDQKRVMASDESMSLIACEVEECAFSTPKLGRDAYPAMVAHLQVGMCLCLNLVNPKHLVH